MQQLSTDVLVVGAGPAGLTAAAALARLGVSALTVTKYGGPADSPRAHITNQRAVEIFRDFGIEERVQARALPQALMGKQVFATSFAGREISRLMTWGTGDDRYADYKSASPCDMCNAPQHVLEPILLDAARGFGADIRFNHEVVSVRQTAECVLTSVRNRVDGSESEIRSRYAIGCDGARTVVGESGDFRLEGRAGLANAITVWIEADLTRYTKHRSGALFFTCSPGSDDVFSIWTCVEPWTEWSTIFIQHDGTASEVSEEAVMARVRAAVGDPEIPIRIKKISEWQFNHIVAGRYRDRRLFIAGDAAHRHPPANGLGSNTSIQDTYNLAWKLGLVLAGTASDSLLDSYDQERQPVGRQVVDRANKSVEDMFPYIEALGFRPDQHPDDAGQMLDRIFGPDGEETREALRRGLELMNWQFNAHGVELGQRYESAAVVGDGTPFPPYERDPELYYHPTSHPGAPLPHVWLERGLEQVSSLDLCSYEAFTLLIGAGGAEWHAAAQDVSEATGVPITPVTIGLGQATNDVLGDWVRRREIGDRGCLLVRPDRIVGWRSHDLVEDPRSALEAAMRQILGRPL